MSCISARFWHLFMLYGLTYVEMVEVVLSWSLCFLRKRLKSTIYNKSEVIVACLEHLVVFARRRVIITMAKAIEKVSDRATFPNTFYVTPYF